MKKFFILLVLFYVFFMVSCGGGNANTTQGNLYEKCYPNGTCNQGLICDIENNVCVKNWCKSNNDCTDPEYPICNTGTGNCESSEDKKPVDNSDSDSQDSGDSDTGKPDDKTNTAQENDNSDSVDSVDDSGDSTDDDFSDTNDDADDGDTDSSSATDADSETDNSDSLTLPECSTSSGTPCYDSTSHLTWSAKLDSQDCNNYSEGGFNYWRLPTIDELKTLIIVPNGTPKTALCQVSETNGHLTRDDWTCSTCSESCTQLSDAIGCDTCEHFDDGRFSKLGDSSELSSSSNFYNDASDYPIGYWYVDFSRGFIFRDSYYNSTIKAARCVR